MTCQLQPCGGCVEFAKLEATKPTSRNFLDLIHKRHLLKSNLNSWHDHLASRLPVEIISHIFILFDNLNKPGDKEAGEMSRYEQDDWDHRLRTPALLSRVCKRWRHVVLGTPHLWTKYSFNVWIQARDLGPLKEFLSRSGSLPLSLMLYGDLNDDDEELNGISMDPIANLIRSYSNRWKFLDIQCVPRGLAHKILHGLNYIPPSVLQGIKVDYLDLPEPIRLREPLRPAHLCVFDMGYVGKIPMEWDNLTHLEMSYVRMNILLQIVKQAPRLKQWISDEVIAHPDLSEGPLFPLPESPVVLQTLERLEVTFKEHHVNDFFSSLTLPALTHLLCHFGSDTEITWDLNFDPMINFFARSELDSNTLQTFDLAYTIHGTGYDHKFFELTGVTHLRVQILNGTNIVTDPYLSELSKISVLPRLRKLEIQAPNMPPSSWSFLCDVFRGDLLPPGDGPLDPSDVPWATSPPRWYHKRPLKHVFVTVYPHCTSSAMSYEDYIFLRDIQKAGVVKLDLQDRFTGHTFRESPRMDDILQKMAQLYERLE